MKDIVFDCIKRTSDVMCVWDCCWLWIRTAEVTNKSIHSQTCFVQIVQFLGSLNNCIRPIHRIVYHPLYCCECAVYEC